MDNRKCLHIVLYNYFLIHWLLENMLLRAENFTLLMTGEFDALLILLDHKMV